MKRRPDCGHVQLRLLHSARGSQLMRDSVSGGLHQCDNLGVSIWSGIRLQRGCIDRRVGADSPWDLRWSVRWVDSNHHPITTLRAQKPPLTGCHRRSECAEITQRKRGSVRRQRIGRQTP